MRSVGDSVKSDIMGNGNCTMTYFILNIYFFYSLDPDFFYLYSKNFCDTQSSKQYFICSYFDLPVLFYLKYVVTTIFK